jgi:sec-independent protein translocase protein TatB
MLPEVGALEYLIIAIVALIVVGPKDLPVLLRRLGQFVAKLRGMAAEFRASFDEMARQSELDELRKEVEAMRRGQFADMAASAGGGEMRSTVAEIEQSMSDVGVQLHPPMSYQYDSHAEPAPPAPPLEITEAPAPEKKPRAKAASNGAAKPAARKSAPRKKAAAPKAAPVIEEAKKRSRRSSKIVEAGS